MKRWLTLLSMKSRSTGKGRGGRSPGRSKKGRRGFLRRGDPAPGSSWPRQKGIAALAFLGGVTLLLLLSAFFGEQGLLKVRHLEKEKRDLQEKVSLLEGETGGLRGEVRGMRSDPFLYEKAARERLGLVKPGEVVYDFREDPLEGGR